MNKFKGLLKYLAPYKTSAYFNVFFNILNSIFSFASFGSVIPFLDILFKTDKLVLEKPSFGFGVDSFKGYLDYYVSQTIIQYDSKEAALVFIAILIVFLFFLKNVFRYIAQYFLTNIRNGIVKDIKIELNNKILSLPLSYFNKTKKGDLMATITSDVSEVEHSILSILEVFAKEPITILIALYLLFTISFNLTLFVFFMIIVIGVLIGKIGKSLKKPSFEGQERVGALSSLYDETISGMRVIKAFTAEGYRKEQFLNESNLVFRLMNRVQRLRVLASPLTEFLASIIFASIIWYGGKQVVSENIEASVFIFYLITFGMIIGPAKSFSTGFFNLKKGLGSVKRIEDVLKLKTDILEVENPKILKEFNQKIEFKNVSFQYNNQGKVLKDVNISIKKGDVLAIVGPSGGGKTTFVDLIPRLYDCTNGEILIDGINVKEISKQSLREKMGIVTQESILFNDTVANNIAFGIEATKEEIIEAAKIANAHDFIEKMQNGYEAIIGDRGQNLSGGQRQRITLARAVLKNPPILILDEATSALDSESEKLVQQALVKLMKNRTSVIIAHRLSTIQYADNIIVMENGEIIEQGNHIGLMGKNGLYKKLVDLQAF